MKAKPYQISALTPQIQKDFQGALIFGPDLGIVQELSDKIARMVVPDVGDTLAVVKITPQKLKEIPSLISDEINAPTLLGGRKLIWLKEADNIMTDAIDFGLTGSKTDAFLLITSGNLTKNSTLRNLFESAPNLLAVACYPEEGKDVAEFIRGYLAEAGIRASREAMILMVERLSENRMATREELNKLINYLGDKKTVDEADVRAVVTDTQDASIDAFCCAVAGGNRPVAEKEYHLMLANGENPVTIIRILYMYFNRLLDAAETNEQSGLAAALKKIMKPAQFRLETQFQQQIRIWKKDFILKVLDLLIDAERQAKSTGMPAELILDRVIIQIAGVAHRQN